MPRVTDWPWPFDDPPESEVYVSPDVASGAARVAFVGHYDDGDWVFLSEGGRRSDTLQAMSFGDLRRVVPDLAGFSDLGYGRARERDGADGPWLEVELPPDE